MDNFDWVTAVASCSVGSAFVRLRTQVEQDVETRRALRPQAEHYGFRFQANNDYNFCVLVEGNGIHKSVCFELQKKAEQIQVHRGAEIVKAKMTVNKDGECRFLVNDEELEFWQFRKRMLEDLFFSSY
jgi:hypothetical protein